MEFWIVLTVRNFLLDDSVGVGEGLLETSVEILEALGADSLLLTAGFGVFSLELGKTILLGLLLGLGGSGLPYLRGWVKSLHHGLVLQWVLSGGTLGKLVLSNTAELGLNLVRVDDSGEISAGHHTSIKLVARLLDTLLTVSTEHLVEVLEGILGEDDESAEVTTWGELEQVKSMNTAGVNAWEVAGGSLKVGVLITVHNEWALSHLKARVSHLVEAGTGSLANTDSLEVLRNTSGIKGTEEGLGGVNVEGVEHEWQLWDLVHVVTSGKNKWGNGGSSESRGDGVSLLVSLAGSVPLAPDLEWGEHATLTAHVTESSLSGSVGS